MSCYKMDDSSSLRCLAIGSLNPYVHRWTIRGRIVDKSAMNTTKNQSKFFHVDIKDSAGDVIRAKFWGEAAEKWFNVLNKSQVYTFSKGRVIVANKRFSTLANNYELTFHVDAEINLSLDDGSILTQKSLSIMSLRDIYTSSRECPYPTDILVIVVEVQPVSTVTSKNNGDLLRKRVIKVVDDTQMEMDLVLWNNEADSITESITLPQTIIVTGVNVREWRNIMSANSCRGSEVLILGMNDMGELEEAAARKLQGWYTTTGKSLSFAPLNRGGGTVDGFSEIRKPAEELNISEVRERGEGMFIVVGQIRRVYYKSRGNQQQGPQETLMYPACQTCRKKLQDDGAGEFSCYPCGINNAEPDWRYMLSAQLVDHTGLLTARFFADQGQALLDITASEIRMWEGEKKANLLDWDVLLNQYFRVCLKSDYNLYNGEQRLRHTAIRVEKLDLRTVGRFFLARIKNLLPDATNFYESKKFKHHDLLDTVEGNETLPGGSVVKKEKLEVSNF